MKRTGPAVPKLRVVLGTMPRILRQILSDLVNRQPDMKVVGGVRTLAGLPKAIESCRAEAVILTLSPLDDAESLCALRRHHPGLVLLTVARDRDRAAIWLPNKGPQPVEMSAASILSALRHGRQNVQRVH